MSRLMTVRPVAAARRMACMLALPAVLACGVWAAYQAGLRWNQTASEPTGLYWAMPYRPGAALTRGEQVVFCPPPAINPVTYPFYRAGACLAGGMPMIKTVAGVPGDRVVETDEGVTVNDHALPNSRPLARSSACDIDLPRWRGTVTLGPGEYWVIGRGATPAEGAGSFDSRYWGPLDAAAIREIAHLP